MECDLGAVIGSDDFPMPYLERSARGGYHGAYRVPSDLMPFFKKSAVGKATSGDPTLLVDLKAAGGGYVICAAPGRTRAHTSRCPPPPTARCRC